jgi:type IV pilus assembly protein PilP
MMFSRIRLSPLLVFAALIVSGCGDSGISEVSQWMKEVKEQTKVAIPKLAEPKKFTPFVYQEKDNLDPFNPTKLAIAIAKAKPANSSALAPNLERRREPLEAFPLDTIKMVGTLQKAGLTYALLQIDKAVYQAKVGNYIGQNFGMITNITENEISIKEIVQDATGDWVERPTKLELQEATNQGTERK